MDIFELLMEIVLPLLDVDFLNMSDFDSYFIAFFKRILITESGAH